MNKIDLNQYEKFVNNLASPESKDLSLLVTRLNSLHGGTLNIPMLLAASSGLSSEGGEFNEIVKKIVFQGKEYNEDNRFHMKRELGDIIWYWMLACTALDYDPNEVISENVTKLEARYSGGEFSVWLSENREAGDL